MQMLPWLIVGMALVGHGGLHIAIYNRINAFGWPRKVVKAWVKCFQLTAVATPLVIGYLHFEQWQEILSGGWTVGGESSVFPTASFAADGVDIGPFASLPSWVLAYLGLCLASWIGLGIPWLMWRPIFGLEWIRAPRTIRAINVARQFNAPLTLTRQATLESRIPFNQLLELSVEHVELPVVGLPPKLDGYRIAHLSDIHLTGEIHPDYASFVVRQANAFRPDMMALTGDIIDKQPCIDWLVDIFAPAEARDGCYFILGNHDTRVVDSWQTRDAMDRAGWIDLGSDAIRKELGGVPCRLIGNEAPWFAPPEVHGDWEAFRILLSHSPDQLGWARKHQVQLMLAGHTHGGQGRLPLIGPILSPSWHGSRYASGDFYRPPTTLHVTRGLGGVHLLRINCRPELSLITLRVPRVKLARAGWRQAELETSRMRNTGYARPGIRPGNRPGNRPGIQPGVQPVGLIRDSGE